MKQMVLITLLTSSALMAMEPDFNLELLELPLSPRSKELLHGPRSPLKTPVSSPRIVSLSSPRRLSLVNLLKARQSSLQKTFSSPRVSPASPRPEFPPSRKRLSSSDVSCAEREQAFLLPPQPQKRKPTSGEEKPDDFKVVVMTARDHICAYSLEQKKEALALAIHADDLTTVQQLEEEIATLNALVIEFAAEQRKLIVDQLLSDDGS